MLIYVGVLEIAQTIKTKQMKKSFLYVMTLGFLFGYGSIQAQYDDVYYGSSSSRSRTKPASNNSNYSSNYQEETYQDEYASDEFDDESYSYLDEYDYNYTHRIRRFHRPLAGRSFYDPFYWDPGSSPCGASVAGGSCAVTSGTKMNIIIGVIPRLITSIITVAPIIIVIVEPVGIPAGWAP